VTGEVRRHHYEGQIIQGQLLTTGVGEQFLRRYPNILSLLDQGLSMMKSTLTDQTVTLGGNSRITFYTNATQSDIFSLHIMQERYALKKQNPFILDGFWQPYSMELQQINAVAVELKQQLQAINVRMPTYLLATNQVGLREFVEGDSPTYQQLLPISNSLADLFTRYIRRKKESDDALWKGIHYDIGDEVSGVLKTENFIVDKQGVIVFIDPFIFDPEFFL
jgi:hypothetical protein